MAALRASTSVTALSSVFLGSDSVKFTRIQSVRGHVKVGSFRLRAVASAEPSFAGEGSNTTVFPGEACDELGGEFCNVDGVGPEVKVTPTSREGGGALKGILDAFKPDVGVVDYDGPKTVFPGEACDELGGEFCEPDYQEGVGKEVRQ